MKILLLGGTGRTGKHVLQTAIEKGFEVNCLARNSQRISPQKSLTIFEGDPLNRSELESAIAGCEAVISVLNISRTSDFPWAKLRTPEQYLSRVMKTLIPVAGDNNIQRITICSAWGVSETEKDIPGWFRWFIENSNIGVAYKDHERQEKLLINSNLDWTIVRPVGLTNRKEQEVIESFNNQPKPNIFISRKTVARYLVESLKNEKLINKKVVISGA